MGEFTGLDSICRMLIFRRGVRVRRSNLLWQQLVKQLLALPLLLEVVGRALGHEVLQVVRVVLHTRQQIVQEVVYSTVSGTVT